MLCCFAKKLGERCGSSYFIDCKLWFDNGGSYTFSVQWYNVWDITIINCFFNTGDLFSTSCIIFLCIHFQGKLLKSAFWFTLLLNMKHIYIYLAPAYFVYLLKHYCLQGSLLKNIFTLKFCKNITVLGLTVIGVFAVIFVPFSQQIPQVSNF